MSVLQESKVSFAMNKPREEWIDYLRGFGIILMIIGHTSIWYPIIKWIYGFHMPLFFILSGFLYNKNKWSGREYKDFLSIRFKNFIIPYFIWCGICFIVNLPFLWYTYSNDNFILAAVHNFGWIITSVRVDGLFLPQNCTPLWFLTCLFLSQQLFYWIVRCRPICQGVICAVIIAINLTMNYFGIPILPWHLEVSLIGSLFMIVGYYIKDRCLIEKMTNPIIIFLFMILSSTTIMLNGSVNMYYREYGHDIIIFLFSSIIMSYSFMWLCKSKKTFHLRNIVTKLGVFSIIPMGLNYSINRCVKAIMIIVNKITGFNMNWVEYLLIILLNIVVSILAIYIFKRLIKKNKKISILIGK